MAKRKGCGCGVLFFIFILFVAGLALVALNRDRIAEYFFPRDYQENVMQIAGEYGMDHWLVMAIIREESGFDPEAVSVAGATGLMQLMPATAEEIINRNNFDFSVEEALLDPVCNIRCGVWYLHWLAEHCYGGSMPAAVAAYNAGRATVDAWINQGQWDGTLEDIAGIPYAETRQYLQYVYESHYMYQRLYG